MKFFYFSLLFFLGIATTNVNASQEDLSDDAIASEQFASNCARASLALGLVALTSYCFRKTIGMPDDSANTVEQVCFNASLTALFAASTTKFLAWRCRRTLNQLEKNRPSTIIPHTESE